MFWVLIAGAIYKKQDKDTFNRMKFNKNQLYNEIEFNFLNENGIAFIIT